MTTLEAKDLHVTFVQAGKRIPAVRGVNFCLKKNERIALVGESGSGKSAFAKTLLQLHRRRETEVSGSVLLNGNKIGFVFQDPMSALNPTMRIGKQITEILPKKRKHEALWLLEEVGISEPKARLDQYPHELSGGMRQRVMIAIALALQPDFLIMDEPTTALDPQTQKQVLDLILSIQKEREMGILLITHDLSLAASYTEKILVMYAGKIVESGPANLIFTSPKHPYTASLLGSIPKPGKRLAPIPGEPPDPRNIPTGCAFSPRCPKASKICLLKEPPTYGTKQTAACYLADHNQKTLQKLQDQTSSLSDPH